MPRNNEEKPDATGGPASSRSGNTYKYSMNNIMGTGDNKEMRNNASEILDSFDMQGYSSRNEESVLVPIFDELGNCVGRYRDTIVGLDEPDDEPEA